MAYLNYYPVYTDILEERADDLNERRRMALVKKASIEQHRRDRMESLTYDTNEMMSETQKQSDKFDKG